jgi:hypothetical protein
MPTSSLFIRKVSVGNVAVLVKEESRYRDLPLSLTIFTYHTRPPHYTLLLPLPLVPDP